MEFNQKLYTSINEFKNDYSQFKSISKIGTIKKPVTIEIDLEHSQHSMERQGRSSKYIKNSDIKDTVNKATEEIVDAMMSDKIDNRDPIWLFNKELELNVVGSVITDKNGDLTFKVITVMYHNNFKNKNNSYKITV